jgi:hypothetical protein
MTQLQLIKGAQPARPVRHDDSLASMIVGRLLSDVTDWVTRDDGTDAGVDVAGELLRAVENTIEENGYHLARELERQGWLPDAALVDILDQAGSIRGDVHREAVRRWVKEWDISIPFKVGDRVSIEHKGCAVEGQIAAVSPDTAECTVSCPALGHVPVGSRQMGTIGFVIPVEHVRPIGPQTAGGVPSHT